MEGGLIGWDNASKLSMLPRNLCAADTEEEIELMWSGNLLRVLDDVRRIAQEIQNEA